MSPPIWERADLVPLVVDHDQRRILRRNQADRQLDHESRWNLAQRLPLVPLLYGWTNEAKPRSRRIDSMTQNVVLGVKTSAAASTSRYFSITGAAAASALASRRPFTAAQGLSPYF